MTQHRAVQRPQHERLRRRPFPTGATAGAFALALGALALVGCPETDPPPEDLPGNGTVIPLDAHARVHSDGGRIVDPLGEPLRLRCVNVDGWLTPTPYLVSDSGNALFISPSEFMARLDEVVGPTRAAVFWESWREHFITERDFERMAALGFNCARLVIYGRGITALEDGVAVVDPARLAAVDAAVAWGRAHNVYLVLDLHAAPGGQNAVATVSDVPSTDLVARLWEGPSAEANQAATVAIWRALAERYSGEVAVAGYDLLNEPALPEGVDGSQLVALYRRIVAEIRSVDSGHMLVVEGDRLAHDFSMFDEPLDDNMAYEFHAYALTGFEDWATPEQSDLQPYLDLRADHGRPLWLGEFGEGNQQWQVDVVDLVEANDIGWALYPWKRKQTLFWNPVVQLIPPAPKWYRLAAYLAQPADGEVPAPSEQEAEEGMAEVLQAMRLSSCSEDRGLVEALLR